MNTVTNGKGSKSRVTSPAKFRRNFDEIKWRNSIRKAGWKAADSLAKNFPVSFRQAAMTESVLYKKSFRKEFVDNCQ